MKISQKLLFISVFASFTFSVNAQSSLKTNLKKHVYALASDEMQGRGTGTEHALMAAEYILSEWSEEGAETDRDTTFIFPFGEGKYNNVVRIIRGNDKNFSNEHIVIGAHYDHLGVKKGQIYNGADDNASGTAALIELGKILKKNQSKLKRNVVLVAFDAEEIGLKGSEVFIQSFTNDIDKVKLMMSIDMIGWYKASGEVSYSGSGTIENGKALLTNPQIVPKGLNVVTKNFEKSVFTATDTQPFAKMNIPTLAVTTGTKSPYHKPEDDAHLIDYEGLTLITEHIINLTEFLANDPNLASTGKIARKHIDKQPLFNIGVAANIGTNYHHYTDGPIDGKTTTSYGAGLVTQVNLGNWALRPEVHYDRIQAKYPGGKIATDNLTIPLSLVLQVVDGGIGFDVFGGGYYTYRFGGKQGSEPIDFQNTFNRTEFGLTYGFGFWVRPFKIGFTNRRAMTDFTQIPNADDAHIRNRTNYLTISLMF